MTEDDDEPEGHVSTAHAQSVSVSQKVDAGGYTGTTATGLVPTQTLLAAFDFIDSEVR